LLAGQVRHAFTHFDLELSVLAAAGLGFDVAGGIWCPPDGLADHPLPTVMRKVADHARRALDAPAPAAKPAV
jgi:A/G-specific adenine glycosylase